MWTLAACLGGHLDRCLLNNRLHLKANETALGPPDFQKTGMIDAHLVLHFVGGDRRRWAQLLQTRSCRTVSYGTRVQCFLPRKGWFQMLPANDDLQALETGNLSSSSPLALSGSSSQPKAWWVETRIPLRRLLPRPGGWKMRNPNSVLPVTAAFEAGWPGERATPAAAAMRVYAAVHTLAGWASGASSSAVVAATSSTSTSGSRPASRRSRRR